MTICAKLWLSYKQSEGIDVLERILEQNVKEIRNEDASITASEFCAQLLELCDQNDEDASLYRMLQIDDCNAASMRISFIGVLLRQRVLRVGVLSLLLEKFAANGQCGMEVQDARLSLKILQELRSFDITSSSLIVEKILTVLPYLIYPLQQEVIYLLPEIAGGHDLQIATALMGLCRENGSLIGNCLETLGALDLNSTQLEKTVEFAVERLHASCPSRSPQILQFLIDRCPQKMMHLVLESIVRQLETVFGESASQQEGENERMVWECISNCIRTQPYWFVIYFANLTKSLQENGTLSFTEFSLLMIAFSFPQFHKEARNHTKKLVESKQISYSLVKVYVDSNAVIVACFINQILDMAVFLVEEVDYSGRCLECGMYIILRLILAHSNARDANEEHTGTYGKAVDRLKKLLYKLPRTRLLSAILELVCWLACPQLQAEETRHAIASVGSNACGISSVYHEYFLEILADTKITARNTALHVLEQPLWHLLKLSDALSETDVKLLYRILFTITSDRAELEDTWRSFLVRNTAKYRRFGVVGAFAQWNDAFLRSDTNIQRSATLVEKFALPPELTSFSSDTDSDIVEFVSEEWERVLQSPSFLQQGTNHASPEGLCLEALRRPCTEWLFTNVLRQRDDNRLSAVCTNDDELWKPKLWMDLSEGKAIAYLDALHRDDLAFRMLSLLCTVHMAQGRLNELEAIVLQIPVLLIENISADSARTMSMEGQDCLCSALWVAINWFRCLVNGFCVKQATQSQVCFAYKRLQHIQQLECVLKELALQNMSFEPYKKETTSRSKKSSANDHDAIVETFVPLQPCVLVLFSACLQDHRESDTAVEFLMLLAVKLVNECAETLHHKPRNANCVAMERSARSLLCISRLHEKGIWTTIRVLVRKRVELTSNKTITRAFITLATSFCSFLYWMATNTEGQISCTLQLEVCHFLMRAIGELLIPWKDEEPLQNLPLQAEVSAAQGDVLSIDNKKLILCFDGVRSLLETLDHEFDLELIALLEILVSLMCRCSFTEHLKRLSFADHLQQVTKLKNDSVQQEIRDKSHELSLLARKCKEYIGNGDGDLKKSMSLLRVHISYSLSILNTLQNLLVFEFIPFVDEHSSSTGTCESTAKTFWLHQNSMDECFRMMMQMLVLATQRLPKDEIHSDNPTRHVPDLQLNHFMQAVYVFDGLVCLARCFSTTQILLATFQMGTQFLNVVVQSLPFLLKRVSSRASRALECVSVVQATTRQLHSLCAHCRSRNIACIISHIPKMKKILETILFDGRQLAIANKIDEGCTIGILQTRRMKPTASIQTQPGAEA